MENNMIHHELDAQGEKTVKRRMLDSLREIVFGLEDGIVSTLGAITGIAAGTQSTSIVILSGFVIIFVESLSMAAGTFLSSKSEQELEERMLVEEAYEIEHHPEKERNELKHFYTERGFTPEEVEILVNRITQDKELWLEEMAFKELGVIPGQEGNARVDAFVMGISYILGGMVALTSYFFLPIAYAIPIAIGVSVAFLFIVGYIKGRVTYTRAVRSGIEMVVVSISAAAVGYIVGQVVTALFGLNLT